MANIAGAYNPDAAPSSDFEPIPAGDYRAEIIESEVEDISRTNPYGRCLKLTWKVGGGEYDGRLLWQRINLWAENMRNIDKVRSIAEQQFAAVRHATGKLHVQDSVELHHIPCLVRVSVEVDKTGQYPPKNEIKNVKAVNGAAPAAPAAPGAAPQRTPPSQAAAPAGGRSAPWRQPQPAG